VYDSIGNLIKDGIEHISAIKWNVYGKITEIDHSTTTTSHPTKNIYYYYDAGGNRIGKNTTRGDSIAASYTWYVRDASGNVMATYAASIDTAKVLDSADVHIGEKHIYGSSRLGIITANYSTDANTDGLNAYTSPWTGAHLPYYTGKKQYELTNHLGNVLATITDKKIGISLTTDSSLIDHYEADVMTAQDYYPFGMIMPGRMYTSLQVPGGSVTGTTQVNGYTVPVDLTLNSRTADKPSEYVATQFIDLVESFESGDSTDVVTTYLADTSYAGTGNGGSAADGVAGQGKYRYGFNGKEKDDEVKGVGDQIDYGFRIYDPRVGRFLSLDPLQTQYPMLTPFQYAGNDPVSGVDLDGKEFSWFMDVVKFEKKYFGTNHIEKIGEGFTERATKTITDAYNGIKKLISNHPNGPIYGNGFTTLTAGIPPQGVIDFPSDGEVGAAMMSNSLKEYSGLIQKAFKGDDKAIGALFYEGALLFLPLGEEGKLFGEGLQAGKALPESEKYLLEALQRQGVDASEGIPANLREAWSTEEYDFEVRIHAAEEGYGKQGDIYRVARRKTGVQPGTNAQGYGWEYLDANGEWHPQSTLKPGKKGNVNPKYNPQAASDTHIPKPEKIKPPAKNENKATQSGSDQKEQPK